MFIIIIFPPPWPPRLHHVHQNINVAMHVAPSCYQTMYMRPIDSTGRGVVVDGCESVSALVRMG